VIVCLFWPIPHWVGRLIRGAAAALILATSVALSGQPGPPMSRPWRCWAMPATASSVFPSVLVDPACESFPAGIASLQLVPRESRRFSGPIGPPGAPSGLAATIVERTVTLGWLPPPSAGGPTWSYIVEAGSSPGRGDLGVADTGSPVAGLVATEVPPGVYYMRVRARNADGPGPPSNEVVVVIGGDCADVPGAPFGLTAAIADSSVTLTWQAPLGGCAPAVYWIDAGSAPGLADLASFSTGSEATTFQANGVPNGTYYVRVRSGSQAGTSNPSNEVAFTVGTSPCSAAPDTPTGLTATVLGTIVTLVWTAAAGSPAAYILEAGSALGLSDLLVHDTKSTANSLTASAGVGTYFVRLRSRNNCGISPPTPDVVVNVTGAAPLPPVILAHPSDLAVPAGATSSFTAAASGEPAPTVQWQARADAGAAWVDIPGAVNPTMTLVAAKTDDGRQFRAVFTNPLGSAATNAATLTVTTAPGTAPVVTAHPSNQTVADGAFVTFSAAASGDPPPTVQWQSRMGAGFTDIPGATATSYSFTARTSDDNREFRAVFANLHGTATTNAATLRVTGAPATPPAITAHPANQCVVAAGNIVSFSAAASGTPAPTAQWQSGVDGSAVFTDIAGATATTYGFAATALDRGRLFRAVFTNPAGAATTNVATLGLAPTIAMHPSDQSVVAGTEVEFRAAAVGFPRPTAQWQSRPNNSAAFANISGGLAYRFIALPEHDGWQFRAVFTIELGTPFACSTPTDPATLHVLSSGFTDRTGARARP
jgi:hypothetical protein